MDSDTPKSSTRSSGPLRIYQDEDNKLFVAGFGLWIPIESEKQGRLIIQELEEQGFKICY